MKSLFIFCIALLLCFSQYSAANEPSLENNTAQCTVIATQVAESLNEELHNSITKSCGTKTIYAGNMKEATLVCIDDNVDGITEWLVVTVPALQCKVHFAQRMNVGKMSDF